MTKLPLALILFRLLAGFLLLGFSYFHIAHYNTIAVVLFTAGLVSDIFDGIIARRLNVSTPALRRLDSSVDQVFFVLTAVATYIACPDFFKTHYIELIFLLGFEALAYLVCYLKFRKEVATHAISSKIWTLVLFATILQIMLTCDSGVLFQVCLYLGVVTRLEIVAILFVLKVWATDVPTVYHALLLRRGIAIKRNKLFNG